VRGESVDFDSMHGEFWLGTAPLGLTSAI